MNNKLYILKQHNTHTHTNKTYIYIYNIYNTTHKNITNKNQHAQTNKHKE